MKIHPIKTHRIEPAAHTLEALVDEYLSADVHENSVLVITSKIVSLCENRVVKNDGTENQKRNLIIEESDLYIDHSYENHSFILTIKNSILIPSAGIDESNGGEYYILWPRHPQKTANTIRRHIMTTRHVKNLGVLITDSSTSPLKFGISGVSLSHSGFNATRDYVGKPDLYGRPLQWTKSNVRDSLAAIAVLAMGEGAESTPLCLLSELPFVEFVDHEPTSEELAELHISREDDLYAPIISAAPWKKGGGGTGS